MTLSESLGTELTSFDGPITPIEPFSGGVTLETSPFNLEVVSINGLILKGMIVFLGILVIKASTCLLRKTVLPFPLLPKVNLTIILSFSLDLSPVYLLHFNADTTWNSELPPIPSAPSISPPGLPDITTPIYSDPVRNSSTPVHKGRHWEDYIPPKPLPSIFPLL
jgi:hypothetical protein